MRLRMLAAAAAFLLPALPLWAEPVTYTLTGNFSGSLGGQDFTDAAATFTFTGDTSNVTQYYYEYVNEVGTGTVTIAGLGTATFLSPDFGVAAEGGSDSSVGFQDLSTGFGFSLLNIGPSPLSSYELTAPFSVTGYFGQGLNGGDTTSTSLGDLIIDDGDDQNPSETFTATSTSVTPEPNSIALLGTGLLGVAGLVRRRRMV